VRSNIYARTCGYRRTFPASYGRRAACRRGNLAIHATRHGIQCRGIVAACSPSPANNRTE